MQMDKGGAIFALVKVRRRSFRKNATIKANCARLQI